MIGGALGVIGLSGNSRTLRNLISQGTVVGGIFALTVIGCLAAWAKWNDLRLFHRLPVLAPACLFPSLLLGAVAASGTACARKPTGTEDLQLSRLWWPFAVLAAVGGFFLPPKPPNPPNRQSIDEVEKSASSESYPGKRLQSHDVSRNDESPTFRAIADFVAVHHLKSSR